MTRPKKTELCTVEATLAVVGGKWKPLILRELRQGTRRFGEIGRALPRASQQMLTQQLRELEANGIIHRRVYAEVPPRVEYSLSDYGFTLLPVLTAMHEWGEGFLQRERLSAPGTIIG